MQFFIRVLLFLLGVADSPRGRVVMALLLTLGLAATHFVVWAFFEFQVGTADQPQKLPAWWTPARDVLRFPLFTLQDSVGWLRSAPEFVEFSFIMGNSLLWGWLMQWAARRCRPRRVPAAGRRG